MVFICHQGKCLVGLSLPQSIYLLFILLINIIIMNGSPGDVSEEPVTQEKRKKGSRMSSDVCEATEGLENEL